MNKFDVLKRYFGYSAFREGQEMLIDSIMKGRDVLGILPTGGGKSICYQVPAMLLDGITIVISPLISLMKDQVMSLMESGISAAYINSSLSQTQVQRVYENLMLGIYKIVYVAPERLASEDFLAIARCLDISLVAVDEAHCISQWGQDFRPSYLRIVDFLQALPKRPVVAAFTATATNVVQNDIVRILALKDPVQLITGFDRPNLNFEVLRPKHKLIALRALLTERREKSGIIYCATRSTVERVCEALQEDGHLVTRYHAGLSDRERRCNQDDFIYDRKPIIVATNAFGMGINKSNVSFVIHYNMPLSLEAYYQEAGRAGRDGEPADCFLLFTAGDIRTANILLEYTAENETLTLEEKDLLKRLNRERLDQMIEYCQTEQCLRGHILHYFGQEHSEICDNCGNCRVKFESRNITVEAQMIFSCVKRIEKKLEIPAKESIVVGVLHGSAFRKILDLHLNELSTYGLMKKTKRAEIHLIIDFLIRKGYMKREAGFVTLLPISNEVLFHNKKIEMPFKKNDEEKGNKKKSIEEDPFALFDHLKKLRLEIAKLENVPVYIIFSNATLADMALKRPKTMKEFLEVSGVSEVKAKKYGKIFLESLRQYIS